MENKDMNSTTTSNKILATERRKSPPKKIRMNRKKKQKYYAHNTRHLILQQKSIMNWCDQKTDEEISRVNPNVLARCFFPVVSPVLAIYLRYGSHINRPTHGVYGAR